MAQEGHCCNEQLDCESGICIGGACWPNRDSNASDADSSITVAFIVGVALLLLLCALVSVCCMKSLRLSKLMRHKSVEKHVATDSELKSNQEVNNNADIADETTIMDIPTSNTAKSQIGKGLFKYQRRMTLQSTSPQPSEKVHMRHRSIDVESNNSYANKDGVIMSERQRQQRNQVLEPQKEPPKSWFSIKSGIVPTADRKERRRKTVVVKARNPSGDYFSGLEQDIESVGPSISVKPRWFPNKSSQLSKPTNWLQKQSN